MSEDASSSSRKRKSDNSCSHAEEQDENEYRLKNCHNLVKKIKGELIKGPSGDSWASTKGDPVLALLLHFVQFVVDKKNLNKIMEEQDPKPDFVISTSCGDIDVVRLIAGVCTSFKVEKLSTLNEMMFVKKDHLNETILESLHTIALEIDKAGVTFKKMETEQLRKLLSLTDTLKIIKSPACISTLTSQDEIFNRIIARSTAASASIESKRKNGKASAAKKQEDEDEDEE